MRYCKISKEMLLYLGFYLFCQFEFRAPEFDAVFSVECTLYSPQLLGGRGSVSSSGTLASNRQNTASPKYNDNLTIPHLWSKLFSTSVLLRIG
jgi:hypothetical protein